MAHTSDRTLLASLGFADPDKKDRRHTLACQYLCQPDVAVRLLARFEPDVSRPRPTLGPITLAEGARGPDPDLSSYAAALMDAAIEVPVLKGHDYLVGFWDVRLIYHTFTPFYAEAGVEKEVGWNYLDQRTNKWEFHPGDRDQSRVDRLSTGWAWKAASNPMEKIISRTYVPKFRAENRFLYVEVKARPVDVADIARQVALYQLHGGQREGRRFVVATCYPMPAVDKATLKAKNIEHVYLGDGFTEYCRQRDAEKAEPDEGL